MGPRAGDAEREILPPLSQANYERHLRHLTRHYRVVALEGLQQAVASRRRGDRFPIALTFDDDMAWHVTHALPGLRAEGLRATFFFCGSFLDPDDRGFWWHDLQRVYDAGQDLTPLAELLPENDRPELDGTSRDTRRLAFRLARLPPEPHLAMEKRLRELAGGPAAREAISTKGVETIVREGHALGFHTRKHQSLPGLDDAELEESLNDYRDEIEAIAEAPVRTLAYPHTDHDDRVVAALRKNGFEQALTLRRVAVTEASDPFRLGRVEIKGASLGEFVVQVVRGLLSPDRGASG